MTGQLSSLVFSKPTPPWCCLGVAFALPTLKCGPQVSHVDQPSPSTNSQFSGHLCLKVTEKPPGQGWSQAWHMGCEGPWFLLCLHRATWEKEIAGVAQNPWGALAKHTCSTHSDACLLTCTQTPLKKSGKRAQPPHSSWLKGIRPKLIYQLDDINESTLAHPFSWCFVFKYYTSAYSVKKS